METLTLQLAGCPALPCNSLRRAQENGIRRTSIPRLSVSIRGFGRDSFSRSPTARRRFTCLAVKSLEDSERIPFLNEQGSLSVFPSTSGLYAIYDNSETLQYIGLSRRLKSSIEAHLASVPELCISVKILEVEGASRDGLVEAWKAWMEEHVEKAGEVPPGNEQGSTLFTAKKPARAKEEIKLTPGKHVSLTIPLIELVDKVVKETKVLAFIKGTRSTPQCGFSFRVLTLLNEAKVDYETINVLDEEHNANIREVLKEYSQWPTIPQVYVKGEFVGGADILEEMATSGELKKVLSS